MPVALKQLERELDSVLKPEQFNDYCPNGLQVEGVPNVSRLVTGVTASQALIEKAIEAGADLLLVHHGYFWKGEDPSVTGIKKRRIEALLANGISLMAYHLPLDVHPELGNNAQLGKLLDFEVTGEFANYNGRNIGLLGRLEKPCTESELTRIINSRLDRMPLVVPGKSRSIETVAWCTGAAQGYIEEAAEAGVDAYITGEVSEPTVHIARETGLHFFAAGHHATERYGVQAVGRFLAERFDIEHYFIDIDNPA